MDEPHLYRNRKSKKILSLATTVEALEQQISSQTAFISTLQKIIQVKSKSSLPLSSRTTIPKSIEEDVKVVSSVAVSTNQENTIQNRSLLLVPPINGMITKNFIEQVTIMGLILSQKKKILLKPYQLVL